MVGPRLRLCRAPVASASSDATVKIWSRDGVCVHSLAKHADYVKALAYCAARGTLASGGLDQAIYLWDLHAASSAQAVNVQSGPARVAVRVGVACRATAADVAGVSRAAVKLDGCPMSVYSLAINATGTLLAAGTPAKMVCLWDLRSPAKVAELSGHEANIRALAFAAEEMKVRALRTPGSRRTLTPAHGAAAGQCVSTSSDRTVRLWDLRQRRGDVVALHHDSVWALAVNASLSHIYSGSRDGQIRVTDPVARRSSLLAVVNAPVLRLALMPGEDQVWASSTQSTVECWPTLESSAAATGAVWRDSRDTAMSAAPAAQAKPSAVIPGVAGIVECRILDNGHQVLAKDTNGCLSLWDILPVRCGCGYDAPNAACGAI